VSTGAPPQTPPWELTTLPRPQLELRGFRSEGRGRKGDMIRMGKDRERKEGDWGREKRIRTSCTKTIFRLWVCLV